MKELSIEEKAKAYDNLLVKLQEAKVDNDVCDERYCCVIDDIVPELKESEDDKIKKWLISQLKIKSDGTNSDLNIMIDKAIAWLEKQESVGEIVARCKTSWYNEGKIQGQIEGLSDEEKYQQGWHDALEKQGEQKPNYTTLVETDNGGINALVTREVSNSCDYEEKPVGKVEPKFHEGEWVVTDKNNIVQIKAIENGKYLLENTMRFSVDYVDICWRKWTIQDAKPGDVLHSIGFHSDCIFIFDGLDNWKFDEPNGDRAVATGYCCLSISADKMEFGIQGPDCIEVDTVKPATNIQRNLLEKAMADAGWEFDFEKKELKKIGQNPAEWSEEDALRLEEVICMVEANGRWVRSDDAVKLVLDGLKSLKDRYTWKPSDEQMEALESATENCAYSEYQDCLRELIEQLNKLKS